MSSSCFLARWHPHTGTRQSALRFVLEGDGAHTAVNGERTAMRYGDFIITPPMAWHDHGNETDQPMFWLDGLDIPIVQFLDASFSEHHDEDEQPIARPAGDAQARYGSNLLPVDHRPAAGASPVFNYPYARTREALAQLARGQAWDPCHGLKMRYSNPVTGGYPMTTIAAFIQLLPQGIPDRAVPVDRRDDLRRGRRSRSDPDRRGFRRRVGAAGYFRRAELEAGGPRSLGRGRPVLVLRSSRSGSPAAVPRGPSRCLIRRREPWPPQSGCPRSTGEILTEVQQLPAELIQWVPAEGVWTVMDNLCHIREFVPFWTGEALRIVRALG